MPRSKPRRSKRLLRAGLLELPKDALMKIVRFLMPTNATYETWIGNKIIRDVLPFACTSRSCCEAVLAVFDDYNNVFFVNGLYRHIHFGHASQTIQPHNPLRCQLDGLLYRAAACAFSVLCSNKPNYRPVLLWTKHMVKYHSRCCCCSTSWYILGLLKFDSTSLSIGCHSSACMRRTWGYSKLNLCEYSMCLVKAEVLVLRARAVQSLQILGLSLYPQDIVTSVLERLFGSCANTLQTLIIRDASAAVMRAFCNASRQLQHLRTLEMDTDLSESILNKRIGDMVSAVVAGNVPVRTLSISHRYNLSSISFRSLPKSLNCLRLSSQLFYTPKVLNSESLRVLHIQCDQFELSELLRLAKYSHLPQLEDVRIYYEKGVFKPIPQNLSAEDLAFLSKVSRLHPAFRSGSYMLPVGDLLDGEVMLGYKTMFTQLKELSVSFHLEHAALFASYLDALPRLTKLRLSTAINSLQRFSFDASKIKQSSCLIDALRRSSAPLRAVRLNGVYCTKETYWQMMQKFRESLQRLEMMMHSPWAPVGSSGFICVQASCADVIDVLWGVEREGTRLQYLGFGFALGVMRKRPFDQGGVMETFWSVQERLLDRGVLHFSSDCCP